MSRRLSFAATLALVALAGCAGPRPQTAATRSNAASVASCRASTESSFNRQNRFLLSERSTTDAPFSTSGVTGITTRGLTRQYDYDTQLDSCLARAGASPAGNTTDAQPSGPTGTPVAPY